MAVPIGTNCVTKIEDSFMDLLASTAAFQAWTSTASKAAALARIYIDALPEPAVVPEYDASEWSAYFPLALIMQPADGEQVRLSATSHGEGWEYHVASKIGVSFLRFRTSGISLQQEIRNIRNEIGDIVEDMADGSGRAGNYGFTSASPSGGTFEPAETFSDLANLGSMIGWEWSFSRDDGAT